MEFSVGENLTPESFPPILPTHLTQYLQEDLWNRDRNPWPAYFLNPSPPYGVLVAPIPLSAQP